MRREERGEERREGRFTVEFVHELRNGNRQRIVLSDHTVHTQATLQLKRKGKERKERKEKKRKQERKEKKKEEMRRDQRAKEKKANEETVE